MKKVLLSIAGYDPTGGAGSLLDLKVFQHLRFQGTGILTAITVQDTKKVLSFECLSPKLIKEQFRALSKDISLSGIKVGMVGCKDNIRIIGEILAENQGQPKVVDPVFRSSSETWLLEEESISDYLLAIQGQVSLITPNLMEASLISGKPVENLQDMEEISQEIFHRYDLPCLITGGHLTHHATDVLYDGKNLHLFKNNKSTKTVHGTGCFLSSSILCYLAKGKDLYEACKKATALTQRAIDNSISYGKGQNILVF